MNPKRVMIIAVAAAATVWAGVGAQQEVRSRPGPGSGAMDVVVINHPAVTATQNGEWRVSVGNTPDVRIANTPTVSTAAPSFARTGSSYTVTWESGQAETVTVAGLLSNGWVQVENSGRRRWINLGNARSVEEAR